MQKVTKVVKLVPAPLAKNSCKDRSGDGCICGSVYVERTTIGRKIVKQVCYPLRHPVELRKHGKRG